jgi:hypothetical protein
MAHKLIEIFKTFPIETGNPEKILQLNINWVNRVGLTPDCL